MTLESESLSLEPNTKLLNGTTNGHTHNGHNCSNGFLELETSIKTLPTADKMGDGDEKLFPPPPSIATTAHLQTFNAYETLYEESISSPQTFWKRILDSEFYFKSPQPTGTPFFEYNFNVNDGPIYTKFMAGAKTNLCYNLLDWNIQKDPALGDRVAFYWEGNEPSHTAQITYSQLLTEVNKFSNALRALGVQKGDRVGIYLPMIFEVLVAMLACTRIGAVHSVVFAGFSAHSLGNRLVDAKAKVLITADGFYRGNKPFSLKKISDDALEYSTQNGHSVEHCIIVKHLHRVSSSPTSAQTESSFISPRDKSYEELMSAQANNLTCEPEWVDSEDPLFMLYTSGSTGTPKGVLHSTTGYMVYTATTFKYVFDYKKGDVYWCTADVGWITGHSYLVYGPLANGATSVMFEGTPFYPNESRFWAIIEKYKVNQFYTAPTAIRALMKYGNDPVKRHSLSSLRILGTVGEPINPEAWLWYHSIVGGGKCPIVDTFWQTETGGHVLTPLPGVTVLKPGSATFPFFGVKPEILSDEGKVIEGEGEGYLVFSRPWPSIMRSIYSNHSRFETVYFTKFPGYFLTGDGARRDADGYLWITGRVDDMLNVSGHLLSTASVESALIQHPGVSESAVVPAHHTIKGEVPYCFVTPKDGVQWSPTLVNELKLQVRNEIGAFATPEMIQFAPGLPKTRSGKIMRRVLRKIAAGDKDYGDISTLADESVIQVLEDLRAEITG